MAGSRIGDQDVAEGDRVMLLYPSANRDEAVFDDPFAFDITRRPNPHVAFGYGTHFCIGANFAKYELQLLFAELTKRYQPPVVVTEPDVEPNIFARAVRSFEVDLADAADDLAEDQGDEEDAQNRPRLVRSAPYRSLRNRG